MLFQRGDKVLFIGDSITDSGRAFPIGEANGLGNGYVEYANALLNVRHPELHLRVVNMGTSGHTSRNLAERWQSDVIDLQPDWVSIMVGINDVWRQFDSPTVPEAAVPLEEYRRTLERLVDQTLPKVKGIVMMTPFYMEPNRQDRMRATVDGYGHAVRDIAVQKRCRLVDTQGAFDRLLEHFYPATINWDRVHVNATGAMLIATEWLKVVEG